jgi:hypothetical protein
MVRVAQYAFVVLAVAFAAGIVLQVFFIGLGLFAGSENLELHREFGWWLHVAPLLVLVAAALAGAGRTRILSGRRVGQLAQDSGSCSRKQCSVDV